jgi:diguanylate cyclase (GGDEF)-like protein
MNEKGQEQPIHHKSPLSKKPELVRAGEILEETGVDRSNSKYKPLRRKFAEKGIEDKKNATHDELTGLLNLTGFNERLDIEISRAKRANKSGGIRPESTVMLLDANNVKYINDTFGHAAGDKHIKKIADALKKSIRKVDIVARTGGDEFIILLVSTDIKSVEKFWNERLNPVFESEEIAICAGVSVFDPEDPKKTIDDADHAMYAAKRESKAENKNKLIITTHNG